MLVTAWRGKLNTVGGAVRRCSHCGQYVNPIKHWVWMAVWSSNCPTPFSAKTHAIIVSSRYWLCPAYCSIVHTNQDVQTPSIPNNASRCRSRSRRSAGEASVVVLHMKLPPATLASHMCTISCPCSSTSDPGSLLVPGRDTEGGQVLGPCSHVGESPYLLASIYPSPGHRSYEEWASGWKIAISLCGTLSIGDSFK